MKQFRPQLDPADAKLLQVYNPHVCQTCYRAKKASTRVAIVLEQISLGIFFVFVYPWLLGGLAIPASLTWFFAWLGQPAGEEEDDEGGNSVTPANTTTSGTKLTADRKAYRRAEKHRTARSLAQLEAQIQALPSDTHTTHLHRRSLRHMLKRYVFRPENRLVNPNIGPIVAKISKKHDPIQSLQTDVKGLGTTIGELIMLIREREEEMFEDEEDGAPQVGAKKRGSYLSPTYKSSNSLRIGGKQRQQTSNALSRLGTLGQDPMARTQDMDSISVKPSDALRHRRIYLSKQNNEMDEFAQGIMGGSSSEEDEEEDDEKTEPTDKGGTNFGIVVSQHVLEGLIDEDAGDAEEKDDDVIEAREIPEMPTQPVGGVDFAKDMLGDGGDEEKEEAAEEDAGAGSGSEEEDMLGVLSVGGGKPSDGDKDKASE